MVADKTVWQAFEEERPKLIPVPSRRPRNPDMPLVCLDETSKRARRDSNS